MTARAWVGTATNLAADPNGWSPVGAPQAGDFLIMSTGTINITNDDLAGDTLNFVAPTPPPFQPFQVNVNLANGTANLGFESNQFALAVSGAVTTHFVGGDGVGFNGGINLADNTDVTFTGTSSFIAGLSINSNNGTFTNNGTIVDSVGTLTAKLDGNGHYTLTRVHDGPGRVEVNGSAASTVGFTLSGDTGGFYASLIIDQPAQFDAPITVLDTTPSGQPADAILTLRGITATGYAYQGNTLTLLNGNDVVDTVKLNAAPTFTVDQVGSDVSVFFNQQSTGTQLPQFPNPPFPPPYTPERFDITDVTTGLTMTSAGEAYPDTGPVPGLDWQLIDITPDKLNITSAVPNVFIHSGTNDDALDVSRVNGSNVLDGSTGSNFLRGGSGTDQFYVDDRKPMADIWSTVAGFHAGDTATIWGITPQDFTIKTLDNQGAAGFTGLTWQITADGQKNANLTLAGYTTDDLSNGKLSVAFGRTPDLANLPGSDYMLIQANS